MIKGGGGVWREYSSLSNTVFRNEFHKLFPRNFNLLNKQYYHDGIVPVIFGVFSC